MARVFRERGWKDVHLTRVFRAVIQKGVRTIQDVPEIAHVIKNTLDNENYGVFTTTVGWAWPCCWYRLSKPRWKVLTRLRLFAPSFRRW
jgi:hypothetical protein